MGVSRLTSVPAADKLLHRYIHLPISRRDSVSARPTPAIHRAFRIFSRCQWTAAAQRHTEGAETRRISRSYVSIHDRLNLREVEQVYLSLSRLLLDLLFDAARRPC